MKVDAHFAKSAPEVLATSQRLLEAARAFGPVVEEPKKTSIVDGQLATWLRAAYNLAGVRSTK